MPNHDIVSKTNTANIILYTKYILLKKSKWKSWLEKEKKKAKSKFQLQIHCSHYSPLRVEQFPNLRCTTRYWLTEPKAQVYGQHRHRVMFSR